MKFDFAPLCRQEKDSGEDHGGAGPGSSGTTLLTKRGIHPYIKPPVPVPERHISISNSCTSACKHVKNTDFHFLYEVSVTPPLTAWISESQCHQCHSRIKLAQILVSGVTAKTESSRVFRYPLYRQPPCFPGLLHGHKASCIFDHIVAEVSSHAH